MNKTNASRTKDKQGDTPHDPACAGIEWFNPAEFTPHPLNPKIHSREQIDKLIKSLKAFGWTRPLLYIEHEGKKIVIAGHGILEAAKKARHKVKAHKLDLTYEKATAYLAADNKLAEFAAWDDEKLKTLFTALNPEDLELTGFDAEEITGLLDSAPEEFTLEDFIFDDAQTPCWFVIRADVVNYAAIKEHLDKLNIGGAVIEDSQSKEE